ncbi:hypothetical protein IW150_000586 [Coemansia sp. RSA 2607]|nr:hypothetical protein IW150_000586 [Coemansia sp. RSA 2607]
MFRSETTTQRPLVISEVSGKEISAKSAAKRLSKFVRSEVGAQSAPSGVFQQLQRLHDHLEREVHPQSN